MIADEFTCVHCGSDLAAGEGEELTAENGPDDDVQVWLWSLEADDNLPDRVRDAAFILYEWIGVTPADKTGWPPAGFESDTARAGEGLRAELLRLLGPSHPHDEGRECGTCAAYNLLAAQPAAGAGLDEEHVAHRGNHEGYACGFSGPHCWGCNEPWPCRSERSRAALRPDTAETAYPGQHDDCIATVPHFHARPYQTGEYDKGNDDQRRKDETGELP